MFVGGINPIFHYGYWSTINHSDTVVMFTNLAIDWGPHIVPEMGFSMGFFPCQHPLNGYPLNNEDPIENPQSSTNSNSEPQRGSHLVFHGSRGGKIKHFQHLNLHVIFASTAGKTLVIKWLSVCAICAKERVEVIKMG